MGGTESVPDALFDGLADQRRRNILTYMLDTENGSATVDELVDYVVDQETNSPGSDRDAVAMSLYYAHLPKLAKQGIIDYDRDHDVVTATDATRYREPYLEAARDMDSGVEANETR